jgi:hypothetical protein
MRLYPKLPAGVARDLARDHATASLAELETQASTVHPAAIYAPTGGNRVSHTELAKTREHLVALASEQGYPRPVGEGNRNLFDASAAAVLSTELDISAAEGSDSRLWSFLTCIVVPDLVRWRFPGGEGGTNAERYIGTRVRNTLSRLWWRARLLGTAESIPRSDYLQRMGEDELVQIMERPSIAGSGRLARQLADSFLEAADRFEGVTRSELMRDGMKRVRRLAPLVSFDALADDVLMGLVDGVFESAGRTLSSPAAAG